MDHENIVKCFTWFSEEYSINTEFGTQNLIKYSLVMKFEEGGDLFEDLKNRKKEYSEKVFSNI